MKSIVLFASGGGSNVEAILDFFQNRDDLSFSIVCNNPKAGIIQKAERRNIPLALFDRKNFTTETEILTKHLAELTPKLIVLAGFLQKIPKIITESYAGKILNIHPSLLPKFGGKGMYGIHIHRAVAQARESESGMTIHQVNDFYDQGEVLFQKKVAILPTDSAEQIAAKVLKLEHFYYPRIIEQWLVENE